MSAAFPPDIESFVEKSVASGCYSSRDELLIAAVGLLRERETALEKLRAEIEAGWDGPGIPAKEAIAQLRSRLAACNQAT